MSWTQAVKDITPGEYEVRWKSYGEDGPISRGKVYWYDSDKRRNAHFAPFGMRVDRMVRSWEFRRITKELT